MNGNSQFTLIQLFYMNGEIASIMSVLVLEFSLLSEAVFSFLSILTKFDNVMTCFHNIFAI